MKTFILLLCVLSTVFGVPQAFGADSVEKTANIASPAVATTVSDATVEAQETASKESSPQPKLSPVSPSSAQSFLRKTSPTPEAKPESPAERSEPSLVRVTIALLLIALLGGIAVYAKRRKGGGSALLRDRVRLHTIGSVQLGPKAQIALLSVGREAILVGVSEQGITCLRNYREDELGSLTTRNSIAPSESASVHMEAEDAFNDLLIRAAQKAPARSEPRKTPVLANSESQMRRTTTTPDEFTPSGFLDETSAEDELEEQIPPHLVAMLAQASLKPVKPRSESNVKPLRPHQNNHPSQFAEPEGQAAELMRRFSELTK